MSAEIKALAFVGSRLVLRVERTGVRLPTVAEVEDVFGQDRLETHRIDVRLPPAGTFWRIFGFDESQEVPEGYRADGLRLAYHGLGEVDFRAAGAARQKVHWHRSTRFCSSCASPVRPAQDHEALRCTSCGRLHFPPVSPAVIVLVQRGPEILLGRSARFPEGLYSTLAGFVEPGETLEECVHREILEEVGVRVGNLRYFGSQPHPFPHSLMVAFVADWTSGTVKIDEDEIEDARWFRVERLPRLPHPMSIARALIDDFVARTSS